MIPCGLASVMFRQLCPEAVVALAAKAGLECIEWGGDVHAPHGDTARARDVGRMTADGGLRVCSYGSYYYAGESEDQGLPFDRVLETARAMNAPLVRVWAGRRGSADTQAGYRQKVVADSLRIAEAARAAGIRVVYESHGGTLTDTPESAVQLMEEVPNVGFYWQSAPGRDADACAEALSAVLPRLAMVHVFQWETRDGRIVRRALAEGKDTWTRWLRMVDEAGCKAAALLEFVRDDSPDRFLEDAATLRAIVRRASERSS